MWFRKWFREKNAFIGDKEASQSRLVNEGRMTKKKASRLLKKTYRRPGEGEVVTK